MIAWCLKALLSHWWRNPVQLFAYLAGLALATALWSGVQAINSEARASYDAAAKTLGEGQYDLLIPKQGSRIPQDIYVLLRKSGWLVSPVIEARINDVRLLGIDVVTSATGLPNLSNGQSAITYDTLFANEETALKVSMLANVTVDKSIAPGIAVGDIGLVQRILKRDDLTRLILLPNQPIKQPSLGMVAPNLRIQSAHAVANVTELTGSFHLNLTAFGLLSFVVGLF
ncbi:MAG: ABC transporter permease, partial [Amylibacter sp.]|nr:ABC transporter permease [Amylibacter sp.]